MKRQLTILIFILTANLVFGQTIIVYNTTALDSAVGIEISKNILNSHDLKPITIQCNEVHKKIDTNFIERHSIEIEFLDFLKHNSKGKFRIVRLKESDTTITSIHNKSSKKEHKFARHKTIFLVDTLGQVKGYINDYGNGLIASVKNDSIIVLKAPDYPNKYTTINPFSSRLNSHIDGRPETGLMFIQIVYYNNRKVRFTGMQPPGVLK
jgi:hypothetical protein